MICWRIKFYYLVHHQTHNLLLSSVPLKITDPFRGETRFCAHVGRCPPKYRPSDTFRPMQIKRRKLTETTGVNTAKNILQPSFFWKVSTAKLISRVHGSAVAFVAFSLATSTLQPKEAPPVLLLVTGYHHIHRHGRTAACCSSPQACDLGVLFRMISLSFLFLDLNIFYLHVRVG